jgi:hypothetical protein
LITYCRECGDKVIYGPDDTNDLRGLRNRRFCDDCKAERKRTESREYQRKKRLNMNTIQVI